MKNQSDNEELYFYQRRHLKIYLVMSVVLLLFYIVLCMMTRMQLSSSYIFLFLIVYSLLRWNNKYIILGKTFITIVGSKPKKNKCIMFNQISSFRKEKKSIIITLKPQKDGSITPDFIIKTNLMFDADVALLFESMQRIHSQNSALTEESNQSKCQFTVQIDN